MLLINLGADVNVVGDDGWTAYFWGMNYFISNGYSISLKLLSS
jgi:hypothetical protein